MFVHFQQYSYTRWYASKIHVYKLIIVKIPTRRKTTITKKASQAVSSDTLNEAHNSQHKTDEVIKRKNVEKDKTELEYNSSDASKPHENITIDGIRLQILS